MLTRTACPARAQAQETHRCLLHSRRQCCRFCLPEPWVLRREASSAPVDVEAPPSCCRAWQLSVLRRMRSVADDRQQRPHAPQRGNRRPAQHEPTVTWPRHTAAGCQTLTRSRCAGWKQSSFTPETRPYAGGHKPSSFCATGSTSSFQANARPQRMSSCLFAGVLARLPSTTAARQLCWGMAAPAGCTCPSSWRSPARGKLLRRGSSSRDSAHTTCRQAGSEAGSVAHLEVAPQ